MGPPVEAQPKTATGDDLTVILTEAFLIPNFPNSLQVRIFSISNGKGFDKS
jgi:hypothetical protein